MVGPNGYFGGEAVDGAVLVRVDFFRPEPDLDEGPANYPLHWCEYEIVYGREVIHAYKESGMDSVDALLRAMRNAATRFDIPYFNKIDADKKYRDVIPYITAIPPEWFHDMRIAGTEPDVITEHPVIFQHPDGQRVPGSIALGYPSLGYAEIKPWCNASLTGLEDRPSWREEGESPFHALQLAMASLATRLRAFIASGGRVLKPEGDGDVDLEAFFGPLLADPPPPNLLDATQAIDDSNEEK
jgi:hypothetical protein